VHPRPGRPLAASASSGSLPLLVPLQHVSVAALPAVPPLAAPPATLPAPPSQHALQTPPAPHARHDAATAAAAAVLGESRESSVWTVHKGRARPAWVSRLGEAPIVAAAVSAAVARTRSPSPPPMLLFPRVDTPTERQAPRAPEQAQVSTPQPARAHPHSEIPPAAGATWQPRKVPLEPRPSLSALFGIASTMPPAVAGLAAAEGETGPATAETAAQPTPPVFLAMHEFSLALAQIAQHKAMPAAVGRVSSPGMRRSAMTRMGSLPTLPPVTAAAGGAGVEGGEDNVCSSAPLRG